MLLRIAGFSALLVTIAACGGADVPEAVEGGESTDVTSAAAPAPATAGQVAGPCVPADFMEVAGRPSPYDSTMVQLAGEEVKVCYGRPSMRGREIFGGLVPYDTIWRTGANEPTIIHLPVAARIAGISVEPGSYSLYTVPTREQWTVIVNRSTEQWGIESQYTDAIRAQEVGRALVPSESLGAPVEMFTITAEAAAPDSATLVLQWEQTGVRIPVTAG